MATVKKEKTNPLQQIAYLFKKITKLSEHLLKHNVLPKNAGKQEQIKQNQF
jgi:ribosomal protein S15P/S13E